MTKMIRMKSLMAGPTGTRLPESVHEVPDEEAKDLIAGGYAVEFNRDPQPERAVAPRAREKATKTAATEA